MTLLTEQQCQAVSDAIGEIEKTTDAELVAVIAKQADDYRYIPTLWATLLGLLTPALLWLLGFWLTVVDVFMIQIVVTASLALLLRLPFLLYRLIPASVRKYRAASLARSQFLIQGLHRTRGQTGVLLFISEAEHYVEILADSGIDQYVEQALWQGVVDALVIAIKQGKTQQGLIAAIKSCGALLAEHVPATQEKNELPNHLHILG
jgi:putative membrane protein